VVALDDASGSFVTRIESEGVASIIRVVRNREMESLVDQCERQEVRREG
jgi:hypothetical protein